MRIFDKRRLCSIGGLLSFILYSVAVEAQSKGPEDWLNQMTDALESVNYQGTVVRGQRGTFEALKVARAVVDGVVRERLLSQEGDGIEIIRVGNEVHCILPDKKTVLVEGWNNQSTLFSNLPRSEAVSAPHYDISIDGEQRIAGRPTVILAIRPHDNFRYSYRIGLDQETAFPLYSETLDINGQLVEEIKFADIEIKDSIVAGAVRPSIDLDGFRWFREPIPYELVADVTTDWVAGDLPLGFAAVSTRTEQTEGHQTTHIVYSDGVARVSVFVSSPGQEEQSGWQVFGSSNSFTVKNDGYEVTAFGEVPAATVQRIAASMQKQTPSVE